MSIFSNFPYNSTEKEIFLRIRSKGKQDLHLWNLANVGFPLFTLLITFLILAYTPESKNYILYLSVLFNGVLPLTAVNILVASSFFLIKFNKQKESKHGLETFKTRSKLIIFAFISYLFSSALFVIQNINTPFNDWWARGSQLIYSIIAILISINISNKLFLLQEEMIDKSYDQIMTTGVNKIKDVL